MKKAHSIKKGLLLLASFAIAYDLGVLFHELSHGLVAILTGGTFSDMVINPLSWSYSYSSSPNQFVHISSGALGAILITVAIYLILYWKTNPWLFPFQLIAPISLIDNGAYYILDIIMHSEGDACGLVGMGVHPATLIISGIVCVIIGLILAILLIRKTELLNSDLKERFVILGIGIFPWALAMLVWNCIFNQSEVLLWSLYSMITFVLAIVVAILPRRMWKSEFYYTKPLKWKTVGGINILYIGLFIFWFVGPFSSSNTLGMKVERFSERPEDFPSVLTAPDYAAEVSYARFTSDTRQPYFLNYNFSESIPPDQISAYTTDLHKQHDYVLLTHEIDDPNEVLENGWTEETEQINGVPVTTKQCRQYWIKTDSQPMESLVFIVYMWRKDKFDSAYVIHNVIEIPEYEELYNYAKIHPEQFDPNQIEQLRIRYLTQEGTDGEENCL